MAESNLDAHPAESFVDGKEYNCGGGENSNLELYYINGLGSFCTFSNFKLDDLPLVEGLESIALNGRVMNKNITPPFFLDEAVPFRVVEPFDLSSCHTLASLYRWRVLQHVELEACDSHHGSI